MHFTTLAAFAASLTVAAAQQKYLGFNSGATTDQYKLKLQADYEQEFSAQQKLHNAPGLFNSVRLYTNIQGGSTDDPIQAFPAAIKTNTKILLGMWTSGTTNIDNELNALSKAIKQYGKSFTDLVIGISVGSEDLYRSSADGIANKAGVGQDIPTMLKFIQNTRNALKGTALSSIPVGHVDTWTVWANGTNKPVIDAIDFLGNDLYPYYENGNNIKMSNTISNAAALFNTAMEATEKAANGKPIWVTETGWPVTGPTWNQAVPSTDNAKQYWQDVGCSLFNKTNTFWYILRDSNPDNTMKFGLDPNLDGTPEYDLACPAKKAVSSSAVSGTATGTASLSTRTGAAASNTGAFVAPASTATNSPTSATGSALPLQSNNAGSTMDVSKMAATGLALSALSAVAAWIL